MDTPVPPIEIRVQNLHKSFADHPVLRGVNLSVERGEMVAVVGGSGSGKTVLMRHLLGRFTPDRGRVLVADHESPGAPLVDLATLSDREMDRLRRHWAVVFQGNALFPGSVYENIAIPLREVKGMDESDIRTRAKMVVHAVGLNETRDMEVAREALSGGMAKRVGIARALALDPELIFYDEPTSGLDPQLSQQIQDLIQAVHERDLTDPRERRTSLVITHDKDLLRRLQPRVVMLYDGQVFFDGSYEAFSESDSPIVRPYFESMPVLHQRLRV